MRKLQNILVTGGAGFIGSNFIRHLFHGPGFTGTIVNLDKLTYAGNPESLADVEKAHGGGSADMAAGGRYRFVHGDICDRDLVGRLFAEGEIDTVVHFAAESHVDRSILGPEEFVRTNINGTFTLLEAARKAWGNREDVLFHHVSTDEVYGSLGATGYFTESTPYDPRSPYSASKAGSDHLARAYGHTYGLPVTISNCSNNYGPYQFPEKLIPVMILNLLEEKPLPVYGDGRYIRDWLYVEDHAEAVRLVITRGRAGESYNVGGENEWENIALLHRLIEITAARTGKDPGKLSALITHVKDRPGHDRRYAIDCSKIKKELGWKQSLSFEEGLSRTVDWYLSNTEWINRVRSGEYRKWMDANYGGRG
jgi:dTDP-glucose 4,6-dehydratase